MHHCIDDALRYLCAGGAIEEDGRSTVALLMEGGELLAEGGEIEHVAASTLVVNS
jgi:hypothetical protein